MMSPAGLKRFGFMRGLASSIASRLIVSQTVPVMLE